jgi:predicted extracellular nuclease
MVNLTRRATAIAAAAGLATGALVAGAPAAAGTMLQQQAPPVCADDADLTLVSQVQGAGDTTPLGGQTVTIEAVVVGDYQGTSPALRGIYVQEEDADADGDPLTSEGVFVFLANNRVAALGDVVQITGAVSEFQGQTQLSLGNCSSVITTGASGLVTPTAVSLPFPALGYLERYEGMLVTLPQSLSVTEHFQLGRFGQVVVSSDRLRQPTAVVDPGTAAGDLQAANNLNRLIVDDTRNNQNADPILFGRGGMPLTASNTLRGGDTLTAATGVMTFTWAGNAASGNAFRLRPQFTGATFMFEAVNQRPTSAPEVGGSATVASFNVLNYFVTLDIGTTPACGPVGFKQECRGANTALELQRQRSKLLEALVQLDADVIGLIELENSEDADGNPIEPMADLVAGLDDILGAGTYDYVETGAVGTDAIKVGIIYRPGNVVPVGDPAILDSTVDPRFDDDRNRPVVTQSFAEIATGEVFTVSVNHFKSKGSCPTTDPLLDPDQDQGDGQGCWNANRTAAAEALRDWLASDPTDVSDTDHLLIGDLNSYALEDPIRVFADAGYVDLALRTDPDTYSYVFDGQWGSLDYALASPSLAPQVTSAAPYPINADEPSVLDYNTEFKTAGQVVSLFAPDEFRTSDHDPILVGLDLDGLRVSLRTSPPHLFPANSRLRTVNVHADRPGPRPTVRILDVDTTAPAGLADGDVVVVDEDSLRLRATPDGRSYLIDVLANAGGQSSFGQVEIPVLTRPPGRS